VGSDSRVTLNGGVELLTVQEVAALCRVSTDSVYRAIQRGELEAEEIFGCLVSAGGRSRSIGALGAACSSGGQWAAERCRAGPRSPAGASGR
jgi:excisionase family DNA binding protein